MDAPARHNGFSMLEVAVSLGIIVVLLAVLIPALNSARTASRIQVCGDNQRQLGEAWSLYLETHEGRFPFVPVQPGWQFGGVRHSAVNDGATLDYQRPLNEFLATSRGDDSHDHGFHCPADCGITDDFGAVGTGDRTAYRSFGTSYRANAPLLDVRLTGSSDEPRGMHRHEISASPSRLVIMGDAIWHEAFEDTGRTTDWHGEPSAGNLLFLDGSVRFQSIKARTTNQPVVFDPIR